MLGNSPLSVRSVFGACWTKATGKVWPLKVQFVVAPVVRIDFSDYSELIPAFTVIALMSFTYNIGVGITAGLVLYPLCKLAAGRAREVRAGLWLLCGLSILFYVFYPYQK